MANDNTLHQGTPDAFVREVMRYLDGLSSQEEFEHLKGQLNGSEDHRRVFVQLSLQAQAMAEGLAARELVGSGLTDETADETVEDDGPSDVLLEIVEQALRARAIHDIEDRANKQLAENARLQRVEAQRARARAKMAPVDRGPRVIVIPKAVVYLAAACVGMLALLVALMVKPDRPQPSMVDAPEVQRDNLVVAPRPDGTANELPYIATLISQSRDARWRDAVGLAPGTQLLAGELALERGEATIVFDNGAQVVLSAPARFSLIDKASSQLHQGELSAFVPESGHGFEVWIPGGVITDLGTAFEAVVVDDQTPVRVEVSQGAVTVAPVRDGRRGEPALLRADQFADVQADGRGVAAYAYTDETVWIETASTGFNQRHAQVDPNWRIFINDDPGARAAIVVAPDD